MSGNSLRRVLLPGLCLLAIGAPVRRALGMASPPPAPPVRGNVDGIDALSAWKNSPANAPPRTPDGGAWRLANVPDKNGRIYWDIDLTSPPEGILEIRYRPKSVENVRSLTLHLRSGGGWRAFEIPSPGTREGRIMIDPAASGTTEGEPDDWHESDRLRLSLWAESPRDTLAMELEEVRWRRPLAAVVRPTLSSSTPGETAYGQRLAKDFLDRLARLGIPARRIDDEAVIRGETAFSLLVLPCNPRPPPEMTRKLKDFLDGGGRLMVCYNSDPALGRLMNIEVGRYTQADPPGRWHSYATGRFAQEVRQSRTPHLILARPRDASTEVLARWRNADAVLQPEIAWLRTPGRGWWHTAVFSREDDRAKQRFLARILAMELPGTWPLYAEHLAKTRLPELEKHPRFRKQTDAVRRLLAGNHDEQAVAAIHTLDDALSNSAKDLLAGADPPDFIGVWDHFGLGLHGGDWDRTARWLGRHGIGDVFLHRPPGTTASMAAGNAGLAEVVAAAGRHGARVHAWYLCGSTAGYPARDVARWRAEGRLQRDRQGHERAWLCPSHPKNRAEQLAAILQWADTPGLAGIHLDYIRYPDNESCYCRTCRENFQADTGIELTTWPEPVLREPLRSRFIDWRAEQITEFVRQVSRKIRARAPEILLSAAVLPDIASARTRFGQDWGRWIDEGWLDFVCPMTYTENPAVLEDWWSRYQARFPDLSRIRPGLGVTSNDARLDARAAAEQIRWLADREATGIVLFDLNFTLANEVLPFLGLPPVRKSRNLHE